MSEVLNQGANPVAALSSGHPGILASVDEQVWAARIAECWRSSVEGIIRTGRLLHEAKTYLPHGAFTRMIGNNLPFGERVAQMLMAVAADQRLSNPKFIALLPPSYATLYELSRLSDDDLEHAVALEKITPNTKRSEVADLRPRMARPMSDAEVLTDPGEPPGKQALTWPSSEADPDREAGLHGGSPESVLPNGARAIMGSRQEPEDSLDFFPTPPWATRALIEHVFEKLERRGHCKWQAVWEPACGEGHMASPLGQYFNAVYATDIRNYGRDGRNPPHFFRELDFLSDEARGFDVLSGAEWIITNPPFGDKTEAFVLRALELARTGVAMFVRLQWLETIGRYENIFRDNPPTLIAFFAERVNLCKERWEPDGGTATAYIWLVWIKGAEPRAPFWIPPGCREALTKAEDAARFAKKEDEAA